MSVPVTHPGIYLQQTPSGIRRIAGVSTAVTGFVGFLKRGPINEGVNACSFADFERTFGGLDADSEVSYAIQQFFLNGGSEAWVVRVAAGNPVSASATIQDDAALPADVIVASAANPGTWGNQIRLDVDHDTTEPGRRFNLRVLEFVERDGRLAVGATETFRNLSMDPESPAYALDVVNDGSALIRLADAGTAHSTATHCPAQNGTTGSAELTNSVVANLDPDHVVDVSINGVEVGTFSLAASLTRVSALRTTIHNKLRNIGGVLEQAIVRFIGGRLNIQIPDDPDALVTFTNAAGTLATDIGLDTASSNVQMYCLGEGAVVARQSAVTAGSDAAPPDAGSSTELIGSPAEKTGMFALEDVDLINILCIPYTAKLDGTAAADVIAKATAYCEQRRAFFIVDVPQAIKTTEQMEAWIDDNATLRHKNAATYFPRVMTADSVNGFRLQARPVSGTLAGVYARSDSDRGVWKAPAGLEATLRGVQSLESKLSDADCGRLNPLGVNTLRTFRDAGSVSWGARTLDGSEQRGSEWKFIPVRRTALFIQESLYRGTQWVVFEPNDESLWAQIRMHVGAFMQGLFQQGAFQGSAPQEAFFVKCDGETTTQDDINRGVVNIMVGFAPLKPAEFLIIRIQQIADENQE